MASGPRAKAASLRPLLASPKSPKSRPPLKELSQLHRPPKCWPLSPRSQGSLGSQVALCAAKDLKRSFHKKASMPYAALFLADLRGSEYPLAPWKQPMCGSCDLMTMMMIGGLWFCWMQLWI
ncbi:unnamed protein product [Symbiodinium natans]|uniref:Uncharacterized protein n=1 Tax=Symbiodinium natans TaxID=878477 RepID=A0A812QDX1_9DINO|nr:unnamed protein product [Symbiodinium natans]